MNAHDPLPLPGASPKQPKGNDRLIGRRIVALRTARRVTQVALAKAIGVTPAQLYKYEAGKNRVGAARLREIAAFLGVPVSTFYEALNETPDERELVDIDALLLEPVAIDALRAFAAIDPADRAHAVTLLCMLARHSRARPSHGEGHA
ncbi:MAG: helix-turn-helix transcriptional regulator [Methylorubrum rhodinum]|uniref:helix-turn-helix domain-containing protein n=1 Tax=Methylorubrum rhodinum TaxID=29428 RepID=UPI003BAF0D77